MYRLWINYSLFQLANRFINQKLFPSQVRLDMLNQVFGHIDRVNILDVEIQTAAFIYN